MKVVSSLTVLQGLLLALVSSSVVAEREYSFSSFLSGVLSKSSTSTGLRKLSLVHPNKADDDAVDTSSSSSSSSSGSTQAPQTSASQHGVSAKALATAEEEDDDDDEAPKKTASTTTTTSTTAPTSKTSENSTAVTAKNTTATKTLAKPGNTTSAKAGNVTAATPPPTKPDPVVDDIMQFFDDDSVKNATVLLPPEKDQPAEWTLLVLGIFVAGAILLCAMTCYKTYKKRSTYQQVPTSLVV